MSAGQDLPGWLDRLAGLQAEAQHLASRFACAMAPQQRPTGRDASGTVAVVLEVRGRVEQVRLSSDWRRRLDEHGGLARAVTEAVESAQRERFHAFAAGVATNEPIVPPPGFTADAPLTSFGHGEGPAGNDAQRAMREMLTLIESAQEQLDDAINATRDHLRRSYAGQDSGRHITVQVSGSGEFRQVEADEKFLRRAPDDYVDRALNDAFADAYRTADAASAEATPGDALRELKALTDNPDEMLRRLFGDR